MTAKITHSEYNNGEWLDFPKAKRLNLDKIRSDTEVLIEEKLDGERLALWKGHAYGRRESSVTFQRENKWEGMPAHIKALARDIPVEGEIYVPGGTSSEVKTALKNDPAKLVFSAFRIANAYYQPHTHRRLLSENMGFEVPRSLGITLLKAMGNEYQPASNVSLEELDKVARAYKIEGWILKENTVLDNWWKFKVEDTLDVVVTGIQPGKGKYTGQCGALICSAYNPEIDEWIEIAKVSGMTNLEREKINDSDIGRCIEVRYQCIASKGRLRHPRFIRWRDDKPARECFIPVKGDQNG